MDYNIIWFVLITVLFTGFFFLEGFDYGVGTLLTLLSDKESDRSQIVRSIGPVWDGNEVWMITAGGAMFAAFPHVYATLFSTFYIPLFLMLVALILRAVAFEFRHQRTDEKWQRTWSCAIAFGSIIPAFLWGVVVTNLIAGLPIGANMVYQGGFFDLLTPYTVVGGAAFFAVFAFHGASFLSLRLTDSYLLARARAYGLKFGIAAALLYVLCMVLTYTETDLYASTAAGAALVLSAAFFVAAIAALYKNCAKGAFILGGLAIAGTTVGFFAGLFPRLMVSSLNAGWSLTIRNASSTEYTLSIMTVAAIILVPIVLCYQIWTYYIFRKRISPNDAGHQAY
ncbi:cytochrome d ubiquinol oxidase subunit II [uncultured Selenomonas sp.]|uniref:cytochrome d ubiquinol oxidase subunit II n=1 Tax=uncultured Selenomonas sp. TaxID=159275 RepID=UPI0028D518D1|nr:cytochrome d ubiquinol oxidase subunit II [uncultured Selenomonas sp.]